MTAVASPEAAPLIAVTAQLEEARVAIKLAVKGAIETGEAQALVDVMDSVTVARSWARVRKLVEEMRRDFMRAEILCLREIGRLKAHDVLPLNYRYCTGFFQQLTDDEIEQLITDHYKAHTAYGVWLETRKEERRLRRTEREREEGRELGRAALGNAGLTAASEDELDQRHLVDRSSQIIASIVGRYTAEGQPFEVADMADEVIEDLGLEAAAPISDSVREGINEVCRSVLRLPSDLKIAGSKVPRFVTVYTTAPGQNGRYIRIPFEQATVSQFNAMWRMRQRQAQLYINATARLGDLVETFRANQINPDERLGAIAARLAFGSPPKGDNT